MGCTLSHFAVYQQIVGDATISENDYCLVCEDDVLFNQGFQRHLETLLTQKPQADVILVGQSKLITLRQASSKLIIRRHLRVVQRKLPIRHFITHILIKITLQEPWRI